PNLHTEKLSPHCHLFHFDLNSEILGLCRCFGQNHDLSGHRAERSSINNGHLVASEASRLNQVIVNPDLEVRRLDRRAFYDLCLDVFRIKYPVQTDEDNCRAVLPSELYWKPFKRELPCVSRLLPLFFVENYAANEVFALRDHFEAFAGRKTCKFADAEHADPVPVESWGFGRGQLLLRADVKVLLEAFDVHARAVIVDLNGIVGYHNLDKLRIGIVGIVHQFTHKLYAFSVKPFAYSSDVAFVDRDRYEFLRLLHAIHHTS